MMRILIENKFEHIWWNGEDVYQTSQGRPVRVVADELPSELSLCWRCIGAATRVVWPPAGERGPVSVSR